MDFTGSSLKQANDIRQFKKFSRKKSEWEEQHLREEEAKRAYKEEYLREKARAQAAADVQRDMALDNDRGAAGIVRSLYRGIDMIRGIGNNADAANHRMFTPPHIPPDDYSIFAGRKPRMKFPAFKRKFKKLTRKSVLSEAREENSNYYNPFI
jgi:hypothetical protein